MANVVYIQVISGYEDNKVDVFNSKTGEINPTKIGYKPVKNEVMVFPLFEDFRMQIGSEIQSFSDVFPSITDLIGKISGIQAGLSGRTSKGMLNLTNLFDAPRWIKTKPIAFTLTLPFYTIEDPYTDVIEPMNKIIDLTVLTVNPDGTASVPGFSAAVMEQLSKTTKDKEKQQKYASSGKSAKLISVRIPGIIYLPMAIVMNVDPTYSKHVVESPRGISTGVSKVYPLWGKLECQIQGIYPALSTDFDYAD